MAPIDVSMMEENSTSFTPVLIFGGFAFVGFLGIAYVICACGSKQDEKQEVPPEGNPAGPEGNPASPKTKMVVTKSDIATASTLTEQPSRTTTTATTFAKQYKVEEQVKAVKSQRKTAGVREQEVIVKGPVLVMQNGKTEGGGMGILGAKGKGVKK